MKKGHRFNSCRGLRFFLCPVLVTCWSYHYSRGSFYCKGVITWHRGDFRACASSLRFPLMALYLFTWYHHNMSCRRELPWREFIPETPVRIATLSCKRETTTRFGVKLICRWTGTGSAYVRFAILNRTCILSTWSVPWNDPSSCKRDTKSKSHPGMKLTRVRVFSCKHLLMFIPACSR